MVGFIYIGWMFGHLAFLANSGNAAGWILFLLFSVPLCDVAAFTFGKMFGRHKMRPNISPNKTWQGSFGALLVGMALPWIFRFSLAGFGTRELLLAGLIVGVGSQLGDLSISVIKRDIGIKDMGLADRRTRRRARSHRQPDLRGAAVLPHDPLLRGNDVMERWDYQPTADFGKTPLEKLSAFPRQPDMLVYSVRLVLHVLIRTWLRIYHRFRITGREHLPKDRPFAMVANHASHLDAVTLLSALPLLRIQKAYPAAAKDYFFTSMPKIAFSAVVMNAMPFDRKENPRDSLSLCRDLLETPGHVLILFPEGTRSTTGELAPFKPGIGFLTAARTSRWCRASWKAATAPGRKARSCHARAN